MICQKACVDPEGTGGPDRPTLKNHKNIGFLSNTGPDPLKNHKAAKPAFNVGPSLANDGPLIVVHVFESYLPSSSFQSMTRKYHNHTLQINPWHHEEETQNTNSKMTT